VQRIDEVWSDFEWLHGESTPAEGPDQAQSHARLPDPTVSPRDNDRTQERGRGRSKVEIHLAAHATRGRDDMKPREIQ
jgi:hypothetical protein